ncbi:MAG TPA: prolyl aminopeptidase [Alcaligenaceae bacterium]|nr:prolyl aminopeptidase [Alcaligenaceae bacterium]
MEQNQQGWLDVGRGHGIHWQSSGNPDGVPVVWLHGGPGSASSPAHRRVFDPSYFHIIQFDQRGCGNSRPAGELEHNRTSDLVSDIEKLRHFLGISSWNVVGGSWGGALALAYAQQHPEMIRHLLLRSTFLCSVHEIDAFMKRPPESCREIWSDLMAHVPATGEDLLGYGYRVFCLENNKLEQAALALAWARYESALNAYPMTAPDFELTVGDSLVSRYRVQCHYLRHGCFTTREALLDPKALQGLDAVLVHGINDAVCPYENSLAIKRAMPQAKLVGIPDCGHDLTHPAMLAAVTRAIAQWQK